MDEGSTHASLPYTLDAVDTNEVEAVAQAVFELETGLYPEADWAYTRRVFAAVATMFDGGFPGYQAMDTVYHDLEHTLQATLCWARMVSRHQETTARPHVDHAYFRIGLHAVLLHDIGYLKENHDEIGSGAKFTFVHERRSCELAQMLLGENEWSQKEIFAVQHLISCTGPRSVIDAIPFRTRQERLLGQIVCTADYLGQMSDPGYPRKLPVLFAEFEESDDFRGVPKERRLFANVHELLEKTPAFWRNVVLPKLDRDCGGMYRYLAEPFPDGPNPYLLTVEHNLTEIAEMHASGMFLRKAV